MIIVKKKPQIRESVCHCCKSQLEYESCDMQEDSVGDVFLVCPECGCKVYVDDEDAYEEEKHITSANLNYPQDFFHFGGEEAVKIDDKRTQEWCREVLSKLEADKTEAFFFTGSGDTMVIGLRCDGDIEMLVAHGYDNCTVFADEKEVK